MNENLINQIDEFIQNMELGESSSISSIVKELSDKDFSTDELLNIQNLVNKKCKEQGILCDYSENAEEIVGLPFNINFIRKSIDLENNDDRFRKKNESEKDTKLEKIKEMYFKGNEDYFESICPYLNETFDYDILSESIDDNCIRFELYDKSNNKRIFFAINKNLFILNYRYKHKMNLRGNSSDELITKLMNEIKNITQVWNLNYKDTGEYYWGLTLVQDKKCNLYVGKSISVDNWNELTNAINNIVGELLVNISKETII